MKPDSAEPDRPRDLLGRPLDDLRISVIDRCNFRCSFCMPADHDYSFLPKPAILDFEEITRVASVMVGLGVSKIRLTGGEPLLRREIEKLIKQLAAIPGVRDLALTTNGVLLGEKAEALAAAGLQRVTVSVPTLDDAEFRRLNGVDHSVEDVLAGIEKAAQAGLGPIKINAVVLKGVNEAGIVDLARFFKERGHIVRFIEFMDVGTLNGWDPETVVPASEILRRVDAELPIVRLDRRRPSDVAQRYRYADDGVEVGAISSVTEPFCGDCSRARLTADGHLYTCLFGADGHDLKGPLRAGASDREIDALVRTIWQQRSDRYSEERASLAGDGTPENWDRRVEMYRIGG